MDKYTAWIGIDPGLKGGLAIQFSNQNTIVTAMPLMDGKLDTKRISTWISKALGKDDFLGGRMAIACVEQQQAMPGQGVVSTFKIGYNYGLILGTLYEMGLPVEIVNSRRWKNRILLGTPKDKQAAIDYSLLRFPDISLLPTPRSKKFSDGIADALCISEYAKRYAGR